MTNAIKQQLLIKAILEKKRINMFVICDFLFVIGGRWSMVGSRYSAYPFLPANIGTKEKFSNASSVVLPSAFFVMRSMRWC